MKPFRFFRDLISEAHSQYERDMIVGVDDGGEPTRPDERETSAPSNFPISAIDLPLLKLVSANATEAWVRPIRKACEGNDISTIRRVAAFITTLAHEGNFKFGVRENMNYSASRLAAVWPSRFRGPNAKARRLHRNPQAIANEVYANRMGNGSPSSGDGWRFRGNGAIQLTGRTNHKLFGASIGLTADQAASHIQSSIAGSVAAAAWFWRTNNVNVLADTPGIADETRRINGGAIGIKDRKRKFDKLVKELLRRESSGKASA